MRKEAGNATEALVARSSSPSAEVEALWGWVNRVVDLTAKESHSIDSYLIDLADMIRRSLDDVGSEPANVKIMLAARGVLAVVNLNAVVVRRNCPLSRTPTVWVVR